MRNSGMLKQKLDQLFSKKKYQERPQEAEQAQPVQSDEEPGKGKRVVSVIWKVVFALRKVVLALPVIYFALKFAAFNRENLPVLVGINLQSNGEFAQMIARDTAVNVPLMITFGCLGLMVLSRKTIYPWLISILTLVLPALLYLTNGYLG